MNHPLNIDSDLVESRGVTWDETVIAEHDKFRGTRRKIDEPKTPYRTGSAGSVGSACSDDSMGAPVSAERVAAALSGEEAQDSESRARFLRRRSSDDAADQSGNGSDDDSSSVSSVESRASRSSLRSGASSRAGRVDLHARFPLDAPQSSASPTLPELELTGGGRTEPSRTPEEMAAFLAHRRAHYGREFVKRPPPPEDEDDGSDGDNKEEKGDIDNSEMDA